MKASHMSPSIAELRDLLYSLRIPIEHCESYVKELQILGYDSVLSFLRDVSINELTFVKHDHKQRIVSLLRSRRGINTLEFGNA